MPRFSFLLVWLGQLLIAQLLRGSRRRVTKTHRAQGDVHRIPGRVWCFDGDIPYIGLYRTPILVGPLNRC